jgi:general nucleoside transport system ATP-binding protein
LSVVEIASAFVVMTVTALTLSTYDLTKRFGDFTALDSVSLDIQAGTVHALLGENGAGKSTLVKCLVGYYEPDAGAVLLDGKETAINHPQRAKQLGIGMVYQHFTVVPGMTVAENLVLARGDIPHVIDWGIKKGELVEFLATMPFQLDLNKTPLDLAAGEKQKLEILKQLYLNPRLLILDEPTSVLTPQEADEILGMIREIAKSGRCTVILITHKFREVMQFADGVTVLRRGKKVLSALVRDVDEKALAVAMVGEAISGDATYAGALNKNRDHAAKNIVKLSIDKLTVMGDRGEHAVQDFTLKVNAGEIVGIAGVSGNGQRELMEALTSQREIRSGTIEVSGERYHATRNDNRRHKVRSLPEEPLRNACVGEMSVAKNMALRDFDTSPTASGGVVKWALVREKAKELIANFNVKTRSEQTPMAMLSGGNVQRAVLARELSADVELLLVCNPVFGLDFAAVREIHDRIVGARNRGAAVLLVSEDLDEVMALSDRIAVMSSGSIKYEVAGPDADRKTLGQYMGGGH